MPILELNDDSVRHECALCGAVATTPVADLAPQPDADNTLQLPACDGCGALEFLVRSQPNEPKHPEPGSSAHLHRLLVDHVFAGCEAIGGDPGAAWEHISRSVRTNIVGGWAAKPKYFPVL